MLRSVLSAYRARLAQILAVSSVAAVAEAVVLVILVPLATTIAAGDDSYAGTWLGISMTIRLPWLFGLAFGLVLVRVAAQSLQSWLIAGLVARYEQEQREELFDAFVEAEWSLQAKSPGGHLQDVLTSYVARTLMAVEHLATSLSSLVSLVALLTVAALVNPLVALTAGLTSVAIFFAVRPISGWSARTSLAQRKLSPVLASAVNELVLMAREVRVLDAGEAAKDRMAGLLELNARHRRRQRFLIDASSTIYQGIALLVVISGLVVVWLIQFEDLGSLAVVVLLLLRALNYSQAFQRPYHRFRETAPYFEGIAEEKARVRAAAEPVGGTEIDSLSSIRFDQVSFRYEQEGADALHDVSMELRRGETVGVVGPSGAGKSTFVQLLLHLRVPTAGEILIDGTPSSSLSRRSVRSRIGYVPQEPLLLNDSVEANIRFFRPDVDRERVVRAARMAHVHDEVMAFPEGYDTVVGERGSGVSGGQRQRICIARALVELPDLLVLDEPTSALDGRSEALVQETIDELKGSMIVVIVAHRLSTLGGCDKVVVLEHGELTAVGSPDDLRRSSRYFRTAVDLASSR